MSKSRFYFAPLLALGWLLAIPASHAAAPAPSLDSFLAFDAQSKEVTAKPGEAQAHFTFNLTNISTSAVTVSSVSTSCGCTVAKLPAQPWILAPGSNGQIHVTMNLAGTPPGGSKTKAVTVVSDKGTKWLLVKTTVAREEPGKMTAAERENAQKMAITDRQAVFKGDCARCHVDPARGKLGQDLFAAACAICHESPRRASMVPDLRTLKIPTDAQFWKNWITYGNPGTLMPAFGQSQGGFLTDAQIASLVNYLTQAFPSTPAAQAAR